MLIELMTHAYQAPSYATDESAGMDLYAAVDADVCIRPGKTFVVPTGIKMVLPAGHEGQIRPRSGLAAKHGVTVLNSPGTVDEDYRGEVKVILINLGGEDFVVQRGMRVAQMVVARYSRAHVYQVDDVRDDTVRGTGGFGSTGK